MEVTEDEILWSSAQLNTSVQLPDVVSWQLTERTNSWINLLWLENGRIQKLLRSERDIRQAGRGLDRADSHFVRAKFRSLPDASVGDLQRACNYLVAQEWPVVHYSGHSLKQPEVGHVGPWLNDARYSGKLIPVKMAEIHEWLGMPTVFVMDCDSAGGGLEGLSGTDPNIYLAGCSKGEKLPPRRDLFSRLMSVPVETAFEWHCSFKRKLGKPLGSLPGERCERNMVTGQLDWFLTLLVDSIASNALPDDLFQQLFRGDLMVATMCRRFLLAQRIMREYGCHPVSKPALPDCSTSKLWDLWDRILNLTIELLELQDERECRLVEIVFERILNQAAEEYFPLVLHALSLSKTCSRALNKIDSIGEKLQNNPLLQRHAFSGIELLLRSANEDVLPKVVDGIVKLLSSNSDAASFLSHMKPINLCDKLSSKSDNDHVMKTVFLQFFSEQKGSKDDMEHMRVLRLTCGTLLKHPSADVRMWAIMLTVVKPEESPELLSQIETLLEDASPRVRFAALNAWVPATREPSKKDAVTEKVLTMLSTNSNSLIRKALAYVLIEVASESLQDLVTAAKPENIKPPEPPKSSKAKSKQKQKKSAQQQTSTGTSKALMHRVWCCLGFLQSDPDQSIVNTVQPLVKFVEQKLKTEREAATSKKSKKKIEMKLELPTREQGFQERYVREFLEKVARSEKKPELKDVTPKAEIVENGGNENDSGVSNRGAVSRNSLLNHQLRSFQTQRVPELIRFGSRNDLAIAFKERVAWQDYAGTSVHLLKPPSSSSTASSGDTIASLLFNNCSDGSNLFVGHHDGTVRLWQSSNAEPPTLANAWQAIFEPDTFPKPKFSNQLSMTLSDNTLLVAGDTKFLRAWDLEKEISLENIVLDHPIAALASKPNTSTVALGATDGSIRLMDIRAPTAKLTTAPKHPKPVRTMSFCQDSTLVSIASGGEVHLVDCRKSAEPFARWMAPAASVDVAIHGDLNLVACAVEAVEMFFISGEELSTIEREERSAGGKKKRPACVAFHPDDDLMCAGYKDNTAVLFQRIGERKESMDS